MAESRFSLRAVLATLVFLVSLAMFGLSAARVPHWADENDYLITSRYFRLLFVDRDLANPDWRDNYWSHTQPMLTRYVVGSWLWLRGYDLDAMPDRYDLTRSFEENVRKGRMPEASLLLDARLPMVVLAAAAIAALFLVATLLAGPLGGLVAAGLALGSPLLREHMPRVMPEAPLACFILLALGLGIAGLRRARDGAIPLRWALALGLALGLGFATKLTAVLGLAAFGLWALAVAAAALVRRRATRDPADGSEYPPPTSPWRAARGWLLALAVALAAFVVVNPHLYPNPVLHTAHLFEHRLEDESLRQREARRLAVRSLPDSVGRVLGNSLVAGAPFGSLGLPLEAALAALGLVALLARVIRSPGDPSRAGMAGLTLIVTATYFAGVSAGLYLDYARYYVPTLLLGTLLAGSGVQAMAGIIIWQFRARRLPRLAPAADRSAAPAGGPARRTWLSP